MKLVQKLKPLNKRGWFTVTHILIANLNDKYVPKEWVQDIVKELQKKFHFFSVEDAEDMIFEQADKKTSAIYIFAQAYNRELVSKNEEQCLFLVEGDLSKDKLGSYKRMIEGLCCADGKHYAIYLEYVQVGDWRILKNAEGETPVRDELWPTISPIMNDNNTIRMEHCYPIHGPKETMQKSTDGIDVMPGFKIDFCCKGDKSLLYAKSHAVYCIQNINVNKREPVTIAFCPHYKPGNINDSGDYIWLMYLGGGN